MITKRIPSVDYFRGFILFLLAAESTGLYSRLGKIFPESFVLSQFNHAEWQGLHFWDLIQPGFMMIAGSALYFSTYKRIDQGATYGQLWPKVLKRSVLLSIDTLVVPITYSAVSLPDSGIAGTRYLVLRGSRRARRV